MTGNQEPKGVDITQAAIDAGAEVCEPMFSSPVKSVDCVRLVSSRKSYI